MLQGSAVSKTSYSGPVDAFRKIVKQDGFRGLYRGFGATIMTYMPYSAM